MSCIGIGTALKKAWPWSWLVMVLLLLFTMDGCKPKSAPPPQMPPPTVSVVKVTPTSITVFEEYAGQTESVEAVEIRARVGGILERQAFRDGDNVKKNELLFVIDQQPFITSLAQAQANLAQAEASYLNSRQNLARLRPLLIDQAISQQDLDAAIAKERADAATVEAGKAQVRQARLNLDYTTIRAPRSGAMGRALIKSGGLINASTTLLSTLYPIDPMYVNFAISEQKMAELQKQFNLSDLNDSTMKFRIKLIDGRDYGYDGKLNFIDTAVDPKNGTLQVRLALPNLQKSLRPGQFVRVVMPAKENPNAILVPQGAVQELQGKHSVFVVGPDSKAIYRDIVTSTRVGNSWVVEQGLKPGELVVVEGVSKLKPGMPVKTVIVPQDRNGGNKPVQEKQVSQPSSAAR